MQSFPPAKIRNVALVGHGGSGKTTLAEALLHCAGATNRIGRVEDGTTVTDYDPEEQRRGISLSLAVAPFEWKGHKINLIDTPGYADFIGDVHAALRVADLAVFVVSAVEGVEVQAEAVWRLAAELDIPRMVFINKLDRERADFERTLDQLRDRFGAGIAPLELPDRRGGGVPGRRRPAHRHRLVLRGRQPAPTATCPTTWRRSSTRSTTTSSRASSSPTTTCSSGTSRATCPPSRSSSAPSPTASTRRRCSR